MPLETLTGPDFAALFAHAQTVIGPEAMVVSARRGPRGRGYELVVADPATAAAQAPPRRKAPARPPAPRATLCTMSPFKPGAGSRPVVLALVGPTGAGKTTTIAKLANHPEVAAGRKVGLLCLDTYRIGAVEQLRIYAEISHLPLEVVYQAGELPAALDRLAHCDLILVDTAGRGPAGRADAVSTQQQLRRLRPTEIHLVLPAGLQGALRARIVAEHKARGITHLLATKMDECPEDRSLFNLAVQTGLPMRWLTDGQDVPRALRPAGPLLAAARTARRARAARPAAAPRGAA
jgi:flagellar biosynthesis protein FlhF